MKSKRQKLLQIAGCLVGFVIASKHQFDIEGSEFDHGLTGTMLNMNNIGSILFVLAVPFIFLSLRAAAVGALIASVLCLPLNLFFAFFAAQRLFRQLFPGEYKLSLEVFGWDAWSIAGILSVVLMVYLCYRSFLSPSAHT
jgi:hypothetical protein